jgi:hypothetical protein
MSLAASTLLLPSTDTAWRLWKPRAASAGEEVESPAHVRQSSSPLVVGLPATACRTLGILLPMADQDVLGQMIETQLERHGLRTPEGTLRPHRWHLLGQSAGMAIVSIDVLADPFPDHLTANQATDYIAALRLLDLPANELVVIEEQGELVLAASYHGRLFRSHIFAPAGASPEEIAQEIQITRWALEAQPGFGQITAVTLVGRGWEADRIARLADLPAHVQETLPRAGQLEAVPATSLLPAAVREARQQKIARARLIRYSIIGALIYAALIFAAFTYLRLQTQTIESLQAKVDATSTPAAQVKKTAEAWRSLAPAIDPSRYAMVLMAEVTQLMPPSGIVIRNFESRPTDIELTGEARDPQLAYQFLEDLEKHRILGRYAWSMPQPNVREKTAFFRAQGKLK